MPQINKRFLLHELNREKKATGRVRLGLMNTENGSIKVPEDGLWQRRNGKELSIRVGGGGGLWKIKPVV